MGGGLLFFILFFHVDIQLFHHKLLKSPSFSTKLPLWLCWNLLSIYIYICMSSGYYSILLVHMSTFSPIPHCLKYYIYSLTVSLEIECFKFSNFVLLFLIILTILFFLPLQIDFRCSLPISTRILVKIMLNLYINLKKDLHL